MTAEPSLEVRLFGTDEPAPAPRILTAGALTAELDAGNLRHIAFGGQEIIRAVSFIVRDRNWGTYNPVIENLRLEETAEGFSVTYDATAGDAEQSLRYSARITAAASGSVSFEAEGEPLTPFWTNRTGFVVLHPIIGVAGRPVRIEHADGTMEDSRFPELIDPVQPMMNLAALTHEAAPGLSVTCRMEGDVFEMEDQRNWTDASYKTYVRPLALPWPYRLEQGATLCQAVRLSLSGAAPARTVQHHARLEPAAAEPAFPAIGLGLDPAEAAATLAKAATLKKVGAAHIICHYNPALGHDAANLRAMADAALALGAQPWLEAVIVSVDDFEQELAALGRTVQALGARFSAILLSPLPDLSCTLPGSPWPDAPDARRLFELARTAFPGVRLGGGMFSYFTELNRKRPPADLLDFISFTTSAMVHAGDDRSVMEGLESLPAIAASAAAIAGGKPLAVGPSALAMRMNPYGQAPMANPGNIRQAMNFNDPRQRALLGAAWTLGYVAHLAEGGIREIALGGTTGAFGLLPGPNPWPQPWFDDAGGVYPQYHLVRGLAALRGKPRRSVGHPATAPALTVDTGDGVETWVANSTGQSQHLTLADSARTIFMMDEDSFVAITRDVDALESQTRPFGQASLTLKPYAVARLRF